MSRQPHQINGQQDGEDSKKLDSETPSSQITPLPLKDRRTRLENLDLKSIMPYNLSKDSSNSEKASSEMYSEKNSTGTSNKVNDGSTVIYALKSANQLNFEKNFDKNLCHNNEVKAQEWDSREHEDGSQSPCPIKKSTIAPLEFSIGVDFDYDRTDEFQPTQGSYESHTSLLSAKIKSDPKSASRLRSDYQIKEVIGKGSFGTVYKCINKLDNNEYAIKETFRKFAGQYKTYGENEIHALASLTAIEENTNVVRYYHSWVEDEKLYLVMDYCPSSLTEERKKKRGRFGEVELKKILRDVCLGLSYLHKHNVVHLDVKPENILISKTQNYKLGDLGHAKNMNKSCASFDEGDSRYVAPEHLNSHMQQGKLDYTKVDIFCLGMTFLELATDSNLPGNGTEWCELRDEKFTRLDQVMHLSESFKNLIRIMLSKNPQKRLSAQELLSKHLPSEEDIAEKWEHVARSLLEDEKKTLRIKVDNIKKRRKSID